MICKWLSPVSFLVVGVFPSAWAAGPATSPSGVAAHHVCKLIQGPGPVAYEVQVGGSMDAFNTHVYSGVYQPRFQPNLELTITNVGDQPLRDPRISINDTGDWFDMSALVQASVGQAKDDTDEARSYALWDFFRRHIDAGASYNKACWGETRSLVRFMNCFGSGACGTFHIVMPLVGKAAGLQTDSGCLANCSHAVQRELYGGRDHFFDALFSHGASEQPRGYFPLDLDNRTVSSVDSLMADHYLVERVGTAPEFYLNVSYFGPGSSFHPTKKGNWQEPRTMGITLRPGEAIRRTWTPVKCGWLKKARSPASSAEGAVIFQPKFTARAVERDAVSHEHLTFDHGEAAAAGREPGSLVYELYSPYVLIAAGAQASWELPTAGFEGARISLSFDGDEWTQKWRAGGGGVQEAVVRDDASAAFHRPNFTHRVWFRLELPPGGRLKTLRMEAAFQAYVPSLPTLGCGSNNVVYRDGTPTPHPVRIDHRWRECSRFRPPDAPPSAVWPKDGGEAGFAPTFEWTRPAGEIEDYEIYVSPNKDLAWPVLAPFHSIVPGSEPRFRPQVIDALNDGQHYYWRVRARGRGGVWSKWSDVWTFVARGPGQPANVRIVRAGGRETLRWDPPRTGQPASEYEVYASTDRALSPRRQAAIGKVARTTIYLPATLITALPTTSFDLTDRAEVFYRVVAVDAAGSRSVPTPIVAASRPLWLPSPTPAIVPGRPYRFQPRLRRSTGRWVLSLHEGLIRHRVDQVQFRLLDGPDWLSVDADSGELAGTVPATLQEPVRVTLEARVKDVASATQTFLLRPQ